MAMKNYSWDSTRAKAKPVRVHSIDMVTASEARLETIERKIGNLNLTPFKFSVQQVMACDFCGSGYSNHEC